jgi:hypothetical protein
MRIARSALHAGPATVGLALTALVLAGHTVAAQQPTGRLVVSVLVSDNVIAKRPVMVSAIRDGAIVDQTEILTDRAPNQNAAILDHIPAGSYDVRVEGDGVVTEVKKGVQVFAGRDASLQTVVRPGAGVHVVEYATGGLSREEVAARLGRLEAATATLRRDVEQLAAAAARPAGN